MLPKVTDVEWYASNLPDGLVIDASTGTISGTPVEVGTYEAQMRVRTNYGLSVMEKVALNVTAGKLRITTTSLPVGDIHWEYSYQLQHSGGGTVSWDVIGLPAGMYYETDGRILGAPSEEYADDRTYTIKLVLWGSDGYRKDEKELELVVRGMYPHLPSGETITLTLPSSTRNDVCRNRITVIHGTSFSEGVNSCSYVLVDRWGHYNGLYYQKNSGYVLSVSVNVEEDEADKLSILLTRVVSGNNPSVNIPETARKIIATSEWGTTEINVKLSF